MPRRLFTLGQVVRSTISFKLISLSLPVPVSAILTIFRKNRGTRNGLKEMKSTAFVQESNMIMN